MFTEDPEATTVKEVTNEPPPTAAKAAARKRGRPPKKAEPPHTEPQPVEARAQEETVTDEAVAEPMAEDGGRSPHDASKKHAKTAEEGIPALAFTPAMAQAMPFLTMPSMALLLHSRLALGEYFLHCRQG